MHSTQPFFFPYEVFPSLKEQSIRKSVRSVTHAVEIHSNVLQVRREERRGKVHSESKVGVSVAHAEMLTFYGGRRKSVLQMMAASLFVSKSV